MAVLRLQEMSIVTDGETSARGGRTSPAHPAAAEKPGAAPDSSWPLAVYRTLKDFDVRQMSFVPDAGHSELIEHFRADPAVISNVLTTEEEGIAIAAGAWLGGQRSVILLQSSGVGNCINMLSLPVISRFPLLMLVTMRGEWAEFNPWQVPMGQATEPALRAIGLNVMRAETPDELIDMVGAGAALAYDADQQIAILISQRMLAKKVW
jgi:sulfopyruvate decarboxylase alpha subunit